MKTIKDLDINQWQELLTRFKAETKSTGHAAMRIENTMFTSARYFGGMTYNGERYTYFEPAILGKKNEDGTQTVAWLMVRDDFLRWATNQVKKEGGAK